MPINKSKFLFNVTNYCIIFKSSVLRNFEFYTNRYYSKGNIKSSVKYPKNYYDTEQALLQLYKRSVTDTRIKRQQYNPNKDTHIIQFTKNFL
jgi:hypothetical protein